MVDAGTGGQDGRGHEGLHQGGAWPEGTWPEKGVARMAGVCSATTGAGAGRSVASRNVTGKGSGGAESSSAGTVEEDGRKAGVEPENNFQFKNVGKGLYSPRRRPGDALLPGDVGRISVRKAAARSTSDLHMYANTNKY